MSARLPHVAPTEGGGSMMVAWRLDGRRVLVIGGGAVAAGRVRAAREADARVRVVAPRLSPELRHRWSAGEIDWRPDVFHDTDLDDVDMVLACLDDVDESARIAALARGRRIPVNCADIPPLCDFWFASAHRDGPLQLALSTNGQGPAIGARLLRELAGALPAGIGDALVRFGTLRQAIRQAAPAPEDSARRMTWLARIGRGWSWDALAALDEPTIAGLLDAFRRGEPPPDDPGAATRRTGPGRIRLVGAGPGDPALLTAAARDAIAQADLVLADRLVPPAILDLVTGELRIARKLKGRSGSAQDELHAWMIDGARAGRDVIRLKCGDPFVFGRGGEELAVLRVEGLDADVIPGVTAAFAAPLAAGIPTTMRGAADRVLVLTGQGRDGRHVDIPAFHPSTTYLLLMGVERMGELFAGMQTAGFPPTWPAAVVERATHPAQRVVRGTLSTLPALAAAAGIGAPATIVVGQVVDALAQPAAREARAG